MQRPRIPAIADRYDVVNGMRSLCLAHHAHRLLLPYHIAYGAPTRGVVHGVISNPFVSCALVAPWLFRLQ